MHHLSLRLTERRRVVSRAIAMQRKALNAEQQEQPGLRPHRLPFECILAGCGISAKRLGFPLTQCECTYGCWKSSSTQMEKLTKRCEVCCCVASGSLEGNSGNTCSRANTNNVHFCMCVCFVCERSFDVFVSARLREALA